MERAPRECRLPLSFAQQRLWFLDQLAPQDPTYNCPGGVRLEGRLDVEALEGAINEIVRRHEVLRTRIEAEEGEPAQVIDEWERRRLEVEDLSGMTREEREEEVKRRGKEEAERGFDLSRGPLLRVKVLKLGEEEHVVFFTMHHIVSDGWSMGILIREVGELYRAYSLGSAGEGAPLEELPIQYSDFAVWQRNWLRGEVLEAELEYWRRQLDGMEALELPADHPRPAERSYRGANWNLVMERELTERLREMSRREGATLFMTVAAAFHLLLGRYAGQEDVTIGTPIANRNRRETEGVIGFFVNTLVLRVRLEGRSSFRELMRQERERCLEAYEHQDVPFEKLVEELSPARDLSRTPLFQVSLTLQNTPRRELRLRGMEISPFTGGTETAKFDLSLFLGEEEAGLEGGVEYARDLFEAESVERMMSHFRQLLEEVTRDPERRLEELSLLSGEERRQMLEEWNRTEMAIPELCAHEMFERQAERTPEAVALVYEEQQLSYRELNERANRVASYLGRLGVRPEVRVGICMGPSLEAVIGLLGILKAGGAYVPLEPRSPGERLSFVIEDAQISVMLSESRIVDCLPASWVQVVCLDGEEEIDREPSENYQGGAQRENLAYVIYTSGSTGEPKGVGVTHGGLSNLAMAQMEIFRFETGKRVMQFAAQSFDAASWEWAMTLPRGGRLMVVGGDAKLGGAGLMRQLREGEVEAATLPPSVLVTLPEGEAPGLETLVIAGEACPAGVVERWSGGRRMLNAYGPTETTVCATISGPLEGRERIPIGRPIGNVRVYVVDEWGQPAPIGAVGELYIGGEGVARGYLSRAELTAERFVPDEFCGEEGGGRLYRSGDRVRWTKWGELEFLGRKDQQVKIRGYRIELGEIEAVLERQPGVREAVVLVRETEGGDRRLVAYVVMGEGGGIRAEELGAEARRSLPEYMAPSEYVEMEEMPLTRSGKVDRSRLPERGREERKEEEEERARSATEEIIAGIWEQVLEVERVGVREDFFALGGHSLLAAQVISRIREALGVEPPLRAIFELRTVEGLAEAVERQRRDQPSVPARPLLSSERRNRND